MRPKITVLRFLVIGLIFLFNANIVFAGFGISPPHVINDKLTQGSYYEQKIVLSRGQPDEDLKTEITIDAPEIEDWISVEPASGFILPQGEQQVEMIVKVNVPKDAEYKNYKGIIRVKTSSLEEPGAGQVSVALGARVDIDLTVSKEVYINFKVRAIKILPIELKPWPLSWFNKIKVLIKVENLGNIKGSPTKVQLDVYDVNNEELLELKDDTSLEKIEPFETKEISANFSTKLNPGQYWSRVKVFKADEIKREEKIMLTVAKISLSVKDWLVIIASGLLILIILLAIIYGAWRFKFKKKE